MKVEQGVDSESRMDVISTAVQLYVPKRSHWGQLVVLEDGTPSPLAIYRRVKEGMEVEAALKGPATETKCAYIGECGMSDVGCGESRTDETNQAVHEVTTQGSNTVPSSGGLRK